MENNERDPVERVLSSLLHYVRQGGIEPFRSFSGQLCVRLCVPDRWEGVLRLRDERLRFWIMDHAWETLGILLARGAVQTLIDMLAGKAMRNPYPRVLEDDALDRVKSVPVLATVVEFMEERESPRFEASMSVLWQTLRDFSNSRGLDKLQAGRFPGGPHILSRELRKFSDELSALGVNVEIRRSNGSQVTLVKQADVPSVQPPVNSPELNSLSDNTLSPEDDCEDDDSTWYILNLLRG